MWVLQCPSSEDLKICMNSKPDSSLLYSWLLIDINTKIYKTFYYDSLDNNLYWVCVAVDNFITPKEVNGNQY